MARPPSLSPLWLNEQFEKLHREHALILKKIEDISTLVTPQLEAQVRKVGALASKIDQKVPDRNLPPLDNQ